MSSIPGAEMESATFEPQQTSAVAHRRKMYDALKPRLRFLWQGEPRALKKIVRLVPLFVMWCKCAKGRLGFCFQAKTESHMNLLVDLLLSRHFSSGAER